jgi:hypothetical protein
MCNPSSSFQVEAEEAEEAEEEEAESRKFGLSNQDQMNTNSLKAN